jgi:hypothetical protein
MIYGMNARTKKLRDEVLELPCEEALALAHDVLDSLGDEQGSPEGVERAWRRSSSVALRTCSPERAKGSTPVR